MSTAAVRPPSVAGRARDEALLVEALFNASRVVRHRLRPELEHEGLSAPMFWALHQLVGDGPMNIGQIAAACVVTPANVSAAADHLVAAGLVERRPAPRDRRVVVLTATPRGRALHRAVWTRLARVLLRSMEGVASSDLTATVRFLDRLARLPLSVDLVSDGERA